MIRIVRLVALALALLAQLPSLLATAGRCGDQAPATMASASGQGGSHGDHSAPAGEHSRGHGPEHCAMVSTCVSGCASESTIVAFRSSAPRIEHRLELDVRVPDSPLASPEPPPPRG